MGKHTNTSNAFNSSWRVANYELQEARNKRIDLSKQGGRVATEKQIEYAEALEAICEAAGRTDYPKDSNYKVNTMRARTYISRLQKFVYGNGLRGKEHEDN